MPKIRIVVVSPPETFSDYAAMRLQLQGRRGDVEAEKSGRDFVIDVAVDLKVDVPQGPFVQRENDGRRFVYLQWLGQRGVHWERFRRIKLYFEQMPGWPHQAEIEVRVNGTDKRGGPACARATVLSAGAEG